VPLGELTALSRLPLWILGVLLLREARRGKESKRERKGRERKAEGKEREAGPSLPLLNSLSHWVRRALRGVRDSG